MEKSQQVLEYLLAFAKGNKMYDILATSHSIDMMKDRNINKFDVCRMCRKLGLKLQQYNNTGKDVMIIDERHNLSCLISVENNNIVIITTIDKSDVFIKATQRESTAIERINSAS